jgi:hypothetical protein
MTDDTRSVCCTSAGFTRHHSADHTHDIVENTAVVIAVEGGCECRKAAFRGGIICQTANKRGENTLSGLRCLLRRSANVLAELGNHVFGNLSLKEIK